MLIADMPFRMAGHYLKHIANAPFQRTDIFLGNKLSFIIIRFLIIFTIYLFIITNCWTNYITNIHVISTVSPSLRSFNRHTVTHQTALSSQVPVSLSDLSTDLSELSKAPEWSIGWLASSP